MQAGSVNREYANSFAITERAITGSKDADL